jgi:acyl carrier protein
MAITKENLITIISEALDSDTAITDESSMDNISEWDSLGHLSILTSLDQATDGKASSISDLGDTQSVKEIISILQNENLIDES